MISVSLAFAALTLAGATPADAIPTDLNAPAKTHASGRTSVKAKAPAKAKSPAKVSAKTAATEADKAEGSDQAGEAGLTAEADRQDAAGMASEYTPTLSDSAALVARWIASSTDNGKLPYIIVDKPAARAYLFSSKGKPLADAPVLIGKALGDEATPGIGTKSLSEIGPAEKTTPAGRFLAKFGMAAGNQKVLWVDYTTSVALHTIPVGNKENRKARMLSATIDDNRITFGCINVPKAFYNNGVVPLFEKKGGYVYVLPDSTPLEDVFPRVRVQTVLEAAQN
ncbi:L,D-transpeptidase [Novosphingobium sp. BL-8A]|uniref:L,D-transpeptidase family protein n=1 Tax=Novosphingobium sp. BL-8A TaxID=3127639 RepID=UPI003757F3E4